MAKPTKQIGPYNPTIVLTAPGCDPLPVLYDLKTYVSCWELTEEEKAEIAKTGKVFLGVIGNQHPPVWVAGRAEDIFGQNEQTENERRDDNENRH